MDQYKQIYKDYLVPNPCALKYTFFPNGISLLHIYNCTPIFLEGRGILQIITFYLPKLPTCLAVCQWHYPKIISVRLSLHVVCFKNNVYGHSCFVKCVKSPAEMANWERCNLIVPYTSFLYPRKSGSLAHVRDVGLNEPLVWQSATVLLVQWWLCRLRFSSTS